MARRRRKVSLGYRDAVLLDARGKVLAYADRVAVGLAGPQGGGGTLGLSGITFAPSALERLAQDRPPIVRVTARGTPRLELTGVRLNFDAGRQRTPEGGWYCEAAVGSFQSVKRLQAV